MKLTSLERKVQVIKALAHPSRLAIAEALEAGERCVTELQSLTGGDISTVSKHLAVMREAGWVVCRKQGQQVHYRLACACLPTFLRCVEEIPMGENSCTC